jgi:hypothetical protein
LHSRAQQQIFEPTQTENALSNAASARPSSQSRYGTRIGREPLFVRALAADHRQQEAGRLRGGMEDRVLAESAQLASVLSIGNLPALVVVRPLDWPMMSERAMPSC